MSATTIRTIRLQARRFHKTALNSVSTDSAACDTKAGHTRHCNKHNQIEEKQSPATPHDTSARADWQRYRDIEYHQIWMSSPQKKYFRTKLSWQDAKVTEPTPAMTFRKDREMHIAARQASHTVFEEQENPDREFMKNWLGMGAVPKIRGEVIWKRI